MLYEVITAYAQRLGLARGVGLGIAFSGAAAMLPWATADVLAGWLLLAAVAAALLPGAALLAHAPAAPAAP